MEAKELRIGNMTLLMSEEPETLIIELIDSVEGIVYGNGLENIAIYNIEPIPLTREEISGLGYTTARETNLPELTEYHRPWAIGQVTGVDPNPITYNKKTNQWIIWENYEALAKLKINYVHKLQNLYYEAVGSELTKIKGEKPK